MAQKHDAASLHQMYLDGESVDAEVFAKQRSSVLLYAGEHYAKQASNYFSRLRDQQAITQEQKLRLTKNHTCYICDSYVNNIVAPNPGVGFSPKNDKELQDQKAAELHHSVWRDAHYKYDIDDKIDDWADNFVQIGEVATKIYFDPNKGKVKAYGQKNNEEGQPLFQHPVLGPVTMQVDELGNPLGPVPDEENPIHEGEFVFEEVEGYNLLRAPEAKDMRRSPWLAIRKMSDKDDLLKQFPDGEKFIQESYDETYRVFSRSDAKYGLAKNQVLVVEYFFRPCRAYPNGYFYITTKTGILAEGELPGGIFPIVFQAFKKHATQPRGHSIVETIRPYQAEINRAASKIAEHQVTSGDDKLLVQSGNTVSASKAIPGIRTITYSGMKPEILEGRSGEQFLNTLTANIQELYSVLGVKEELEDVPAQLEPHTMLFRQARQKRRFQRYIKRFEKFLINVVKTYLRLAKIHLPDDYVIRAIGRNELVNIEEFRSMEDLDFEIKIEAQSDDIETKLGKQITLTSAIQYGGANLNREDFGKILRQMPYANLDKSFDDLTIDYDSVTNDILALDRGQQPPINQYDNHPYNIKKLVLRTRQADFAFLAPEIQKAYFDKIQLHQQFEAANQLAIRRAQQGFIPTGGYLTTVDFYVPDPKDPSKSKRLRLPSESISWLVGQIETQQGALQPYMDMNSSIQASQADALTGGTDSSAVQQLSINQQNLGAPGNEMPPMV